MRLIPQKGRNREGGRGNTGNINPLASARDPQWAIHFFRKGHVHNHLMTIPKKQDYATWPLSQVNIGAELTKGACVVIPRRVMVLRNYEEEWTKASTVGSNRS